MAGTVAQTNASSRVERALADTHIDLSICIVSWNTRELLKNCLQSVSEGCDSDLDFEVIVTDNASRDGSAEMVAQQFPTVRLITNGDNRGFGPACNQAVQVARGRHILFLNSDTIVLPGALEAMVEYLDRHASVGAVGCTLLNADGSLQRSCWFGFTSLRSAAIDAFYLWRLAPRWELVRASEVVFDPGSAPIAVDHLLGACITIPRCVLDHVGLFDPQFFMFLEETDLCYRIGQAGYELHYLPDAKIIHLGGQSTSQNPAMKRRLYESQCLFLRKHGASRAYVAAFKAVTGLAMSVRIGLWTLRLLTQSHRRMAAAYMASYARGLFALAWY